MFKFIISIVLIIISIWVFFGFIDPVYKEIQDLNNRKQNLNGALDNFKEVRGARDNLLSARKNIEPVNLNRLKKILPDNVDNVRLVMELNGVASHYGMTLKNVQVDSSLQKDTSNIVGLNDSGYGILDLEFSVTGSYEVFVKFLQDLERSLRIVDVKSITFFAKERNLYEYKIGVQTYWLK